MNKQRDELIEMLGMGISRRQMLKGMGYGLIGALAAPAAIKNVWAAPQNPGASLSDFTPQPIWDYDAPSSYSIHDSPLFDNGTIIVTARDENTAGGVLYGLDIQTKEVRWSHVFSHQGFPTPLLFSTPLLIDGQLYAAANDGNIYSIDPVSGNISWSKGYKAAANLQLIGGNLVFPTTDGQIVALDLLKGNQLWAYQTGISVDVQVASQAIASNGVVMVMMDGWLFAVNLQSGAFLWEYAVGDKVAGALSVGNGKVYFADDYNLFALGIVSLNGFWKWPQSGDNANPLSSPVYYNGALYIGDAGGNFYALNPDTGALLWQTNVDGPVSGSNIFFEDGIAYFAAGTVTGAKIYAVDLPSQGTQTVFYDPSSFAAVIGVETGVCYFRHGAGLNSIGAVNLAGLFHQYFAESELMVEDYTGDTNSYRGNNSSYRTHVKLVDPNKNPRVNISVKVWAADTVTITSGSVSQTIDPNTSVWLTTDAAGELSLVCSAATVSCPALYLWSNFMDLEDAIVIYPDHDALHTLSNVQGSDLTSTTKTTFDGSPLLPSSYSTADDLATTIRTTMGAGVASAMLTTKEKHRRAAHKKRRTKKLWSLTYNTYIAYPDSAPNLSYLPDGEPSDRTYVSSGPTQWHAVFDASGNITFNTGLPQLEGSELVGSLLGDFKQLGKDVANAAAKASKVVWDDVKKVVQVVVNEAGDLYQDTVDTIEKAISVVASVLATVVSDIKRAVQWLSYLFDWDNYLNTKDALKTIVQTRFQSIQTWANGKVQNGMQDVHDLFTELEGKVQQALTGADQATNGQTLQSQQQSGNNPQTLFGAGGAKSYTKSQWMASKFKDNVAQSSVSPPSSPGGGVGADDPVLSTFLSSLDTFRQTVEDKLNDQNGGFTNIPTDLKNLVSDLGKYITQPSEFITQGIHDLLQIVSDIVVGLLQFFDALIETVIQIVSGLLDALWYILTHEINIPVLTELYSFITHGSKLTILDLFCLIVAIPTTIIGDVLNAAVSSKQQAGQTGVGSIPLNLIAAPCAGFFYCLYDPFTDLLNNLPPGAKIIYLASAVTVQLFGAADDLVNSATPNAVFDFLQVIPWVSTGLGYALAQSTDVAFIILKNAWGFVSPYVALIYGLAMEGYSAYLFAFKDGFQPLPFAQNLIGLAPNLFKWGAVGNDYSIPRLAVGTIDVVGDLTSVIINVVEEWNVD